jgi:hypothetical protein
MDSFLFIVLILILFWILDDVLCQFLLSFALVGVFMNLSSFITIGTVPLGYYQLNIGILILGSAGKFFWLIRAKRRKT